MKRSFGFTRGQKRGLLLWSALILAGLVFARFGYGSANRYDFHVDPDELNYSDLAVGQDTTDSVQTYNNTKSNFTYAGPDFNPNQLDIKGWKNLGFSEKQAQAILNYRQKTAGFQYKQDLKGIYVISEKKYSELEPFILLPDKKINEIKDTRISLNSASIEDLEALPLIGEKLAQRIVKYRKSLGGFVSITQLHEVYGLSEEVYQILLDNTFVNPEEITRIKINSDSKETIDAHPYIDFACVASILKKRESETLVDLRFLVEEGLLSEEKLENINPYIDYQ